MCNVYLKIFFHNGVLAVKSVNFLRHKAIEKVHKHLPKIMDCFKPVLLLILGCSFGVSLVFYFRGIWHRVDGFHPFALAFARTTVSLNNTCPLQEVYDEGTRANTPRRPPPGTRPSPVVSQPFQRGLPW